MMIRRLSSVFFRFLLHRMPLMAFFQINACLLRLMGHAVDPTARIWSSISIFGTVRLSVGDDTFIGHQCVVTGGDSVVTIGSCCDISAQVSFVTGTHEIDLVGAHLAGKGFSENITVGNRVWIGYGSTILGGVCIGDNVVIAAGSVVNIDLTANGIYGGVPAKLIRSL